MNALTHAESVLVARPPEVVWELVTDITRTGEWSPVCRGCSWEDDGGLRVGAWFTGDNEVPGRTWQTRSQVVVADRPREFAWLVGDGFVRWGYQLEPEGDGTRLTETWEFLPAGQAMFRAKYGERADAEIADREQVARAGIPATLARVKELAEAL